MQHGWRGLALWVSLCLVGLPATGRAQPLGREEEQALQEYLEVTHLAHEHYGRRVPHRSLTYAAIQGILRLLDPHTSFLTPEAYGNLRQRQQGSFFGLGILVSRRNGRITVVAPIEGTPASRLGLRSGDVIHAVDGEPTEAMTLDQAVGKMKGPKGTEVRVTVVRQGLDEPFDLTIRRAEIPQDTVRYAYMMTSDVGYVRLTDFSRSTAREMEEALADLRRAGMQSLLLDLRSNGGGLLDQAIAVADLFLPAQSEIVETRGRLAGFQQEYLDDEGDPDPELALPLVVLVNHGTASAAEIVAGALQDHDVGLVVGTHTWGKGLVQTVYRLSYETGIALTTAKYYTPSGRLIQRDYSDYYDYYTHFEQGIAPADEPDRQGYLTDLGRTVYGGVGIAPDVVVELPDGPPALQTFFAQNAFFEFAVFYQQQRPVTSETWRPDEEILDRFGTWLGERGIVGERVDQALRDEVVRELALRQIHSDIFTVAFGVEAAHRVLAAGDVQIQAGLELLDEAAELLSRRRLLEAPVTLQGARRAAAGGGEGPSSRFSVPTPQPRYWPARLRAAEAFLRAKLLSEAGSFEVAVEAYREAIELDGSNPYTRIELANLHADLSGRARSESKRRSRLEAAAARATEARDLAPDDPAILKSFARIHFRLGEYRPDALDLAQEAFETLRTRTTGDGLVLTSLGQIYLSKKSHKQAIDVLREADGYIPGNRAIRATLSDALFAAGRLGEAEAILSELIGRWPEDARLWTRLIALHSRRGDHRRAVELIGEAPASVREDDDIQRMLARETELLEPD